MNEQIRNLMQEMLDFPYPQVCRHDVVMRLSSILEMTGNIEVNDNYRRFLKHVSDASNGDVEALELLPSLKIGNKG